MKHAFSLVELSIVLVILGLLTGGILAGQSLIRAAEVRSISNEYQRYVTSMQTFRDKYFALPGDMNNATRFWGDDNAACADAAVTNGTPGTCNGNGDSVIQGGTAASTTAEQFQFWKQMALAGLIEGSYTGLAGTSTGATIGTDHDAGSNAPTGRMGNSVWAIIPWQTLSGNTLLFDGTYNNAFVFGGQVTTGDAGVPIIKPEEMWNLDTKLDDGKPATGTIVVRTRLSCTNATAAVADSDNFDSVYQLTSSTVVCAPVFKER